MSLIGEALKRARLETARREGQEQGTAHSTAPAYLPARRRSRAGVMAAAGVAALLGAGAVYLLLRPSSTPQPSTHPPLLGKGEASAVSGPTHEAVTAPSDASSAPVPTVAAPAAPVAPPPEPAATAPSTPTAAPPAPSQPAPPGARVFVSVAQLGATRLELDGIVASPTDPVAMINRKLLGIGEGLDGWVVEKIEAKQVTLRGGNQTVVIRLR